MLCLCRMNIEQQEVCMSEHQLTDFNQLLENPMLWKHVSFSSAHTPLGHGNPAFLYGVGTSTYQDSGATHCPHSQWTAWENKNPQRDQSGRAADLFSLYQTQPLEIIKRLKLLSVNTYRFSLEWSQLEPEPGKLDVNTLQCYVKFCQILRDHDIQPFITFHHFSEPHWFHQRGSFEREENINYFAEFCSWAFKELIQPYKGKPLVQYFCTINEPGIDAYCRYLTGLFSPNLICRFKRGATFLLNMLRAHCKVYTALKDIAEKAKAMDIKVGISHQYLRYYPEHFLMRPIVSMVNKFTDTVLSFFKTGIFEYKIPLICHVTANCTSPHKPKTDFVGVQFYGRCYLGLRGIHTKNKPATTMWGVHEDPEGLYEAVLATFEAFNVPIIVTENGISTDCDEQRARYLERAFYAAEQAKEKIGSNNFLGYILWSFSDNFEWFLGWKPHFGAFSLTENRTLNEHYKAGVEPFVKMAQAWKESFVEETTTLV